MLFGIGLQGLAYNGFERIRGQLIPELCTAGAPGEG